jgi:hypothetical protein
MLLFAEDPRASKLAERDGFSVRRVSNGTVQAQAGGHEPADGWSEAAVEEPPF